MLGVVCGVCIASVTVVLTQRMESCRGRRCGAGRVDVCDGFVVMIARCVRMCVWQTNGWTPLLAASDNGHVEVVRTLVGAGAAVNQADVGDHWVDCLCSGVRE
jgi:hypothetical protein